MKQENAALKDHCEKLTKENGLLRKDNERIKRILNNDSSNLSTPPSKDEKTKPANTYNGIRPACGKQGGQTGHKGRGLSKADAEEKFRKGIYEHRIEEIGTSCGGYITRYRLDLEIKAVATEIRIYADELGKYRIPSELKGDVSYGERIKAIAAFLYSEGAVLLFLYGFRVHYSNNMSKKDLRICKNRDKMAGGFRSTSGRKMYCWIISFIETVKRRGLNIFEGE